MQNTLAQAVTYEGTGLHLGKPVRMTLRPAPADSGVVFVRTDLPSAAPIPVDVGRITTTMRATALGDGEVFVITVEHVLSALHAMGIDNCIVEMDSPEPPVADGGSADFVGLILRASIKEQEGASRVRRLTAPCSVYDDAGDRFIVALPYAGFRVTFVSENPHPLLGTQEVDIEVTPESYQREIMHARTIGFTYELEKLRAMGLAQGGNLQNALVYSETECLSEPHYPDELVRHKVLDVIGDIYLAGRVEAHIIARKSSHQLNTALAKQMAAQWTKGE